LELGERPHWGQGDGEIHLGLGWDWGFSTFLVREIKGGASDDGTIFPGQLYTVSTPFYYIPMYSGKHELTNIYQVPTMCHAVCQKALEMQ
jgi:hypothetical protein